MSDQKMTTKRCRVCGLSEEDQPIWRGWHELYRGDEYLGLACSPECVNRIKRESL